MAFADSDFSGQTLCAALLGYFDVAGDTIRAALAPCNVIVPSATLGDSDIDGHTFLAVDPQFVNVSPVTHKEGGSDSVTISLSGTIAGDSDLLNQLADPANFRGRIAKLWIALISDAGVVVKARPYYTGYMAVPALALDPDSQIISLSVENYLSIYSSGVPSRTMLSQKLYDSGDLSAEATVGAANGSAVIGAGGLGSVAGGASSSGLWQA